MTKALAFSLLTLTCVLPVLPAAAQSQPCLSAGEIQQAIGAGRILSLNDALRQAGLDPSSKVLQPITVCDRGGTLFYELSVLDRSGNARKLSLPADGSAS